MIDIPIGKALVAVESAFYDKCPGCSLYDVMGCYKKVACYARDRQDGKNVIFKLVDLREEYNRGFADGYNSGSILGET